VRSPHRRRSDDPLCSERAEQLEREKAALRARLRDQAIQERRRRALSDRTAPSSELGHAPLLKPKFVSPKEFVELTGISFATVFRRIRDGTLRSTMFGRRRLIDYAEVERLHESAAE
jgi:excisionase family DNA binding protein